MAKKQASARRERAGSGSAAAELKKKGALAWLEKYLRYTNYLATAQLYLKDNFFLRHDLKPADMKERVLGHWGSVPGQNFIYAHLNYLIHKHRASIIYMAGPGHGAPSPLANLFAEDTLADFYPELKRDAKGTGRFIKMFSWPGGFPSHTNPGTPGSILEGGELGYSLATAYGAVMDNPNLLVACVIGDGEAETGPLSGAWNSNKYLDPRTCGAVLPIILANGYKITSPTIIASMSNDEIVHLFKGYGYEPRIVDDLTPNKDSHQQMMDTMEWAYQKIRAVQNAARSAAHRTNPLLKPKWPVIIYRTLKGKSGIKMADHHKIEGHFYSHGIPIKDPAKNPKHFQLVKEWLESYRVTELVDKNGKPKPELLTYIPKGNLRMGKNPHAYGGNMRKALHLPNPKKYELVCNQKGCQLDVSNTGVCSNYLRDLFKLNKRAKNFRFFCPDETESNKFQSLFEVTSRAFLWPIQKHDENLAPDGRVMEVLSEHNLVGWLQGYLLTGRHGFFATYEAFAMIVASMVDQYAKFIKQALKYKWHKPISSLNFLLTSVGWRQEHNGYSHQNPSFISNVLEKHGNFCSVYFPADANSLTVVMEDCLKRTNSINVVVAGKQVMPQWLTVEQAREELRQGISRWDWINPQQAKDPDIVFAASGDVMVQETMAAINMLRKLLPELRVRFVNVSELTALGIGDERRPLSLNKKEFEHYFTPNKPVIYNFHGYPSAIKNLLFGYEGANRFSIHGYLEEGTTTTPFDMMVCNETSRYHLIIDALQKVILQKNIPHHKQIARKAAPIIRKMRQTLAHHHQYIRQFGKDIPEVEKWHWDYE